MSEVKAAQSLEQWGGGSVFFHFEGAHVDISWCEISGNSHALRGLCSGLARGLRSADPAPGAATDRHRHGYRLRTKWRAGRCADGTLRLRPRVAHSLAELWVR